MKLNIWHWLGIILLIAGAAIWFWSNNLDMAPKTPANPHTPATTAGAN
jgi:hypothetical protein